MRHKLIRGDGVTVLSPVKHFHYRSQSNQEENLRYGATIPSYIEVEVFMQTGNMVSVGEQLTYYQVYDVDDAFDPSTETDYLVGLYTVYECETIEKNVYRFVAYDNLKKLDADFSVRLRELNAAGSFPMNAGLLLSEAATVAGITYNLPPLPMAWQTVSVQYFYSDAVTCRDVFSAVAEFWGVYWICNSSGVAAFSSYEVKMHTPFQSDYSYIIAPTDQEHYYDDDWEFVPVFYKQDGLSQSDYIINPPDCVKIIRSDGVLVGMYDEGSQDNIYYVSGNILADMAIIDDWHDVTVNGVTYSVSYKFSNLARTIFENAQHDIFSSPKTIVSLFPFRFPFSLGSVVYIENTQHVRYRIPIMSVDITDEAVVIGAYGNEYYETITGAYNTADQKATSLDIRLNALDLAKVSKSGDTMSGSLTVNSLVRVIRLSNAGNGVAVDSSDADSTVTPQSDTNLLPIALRDKNGVNVGVVRGRLDTNGNKGIYLYGSNGSVNNYLKLLIDANGNKAVELNAKDEWLATLGLDHIPYMLHIGSVSNGSSKTFTFTGNVTMIIQVSSGNTGRNGLYVVYGRTSSCVVEAVLASSTATFNTSTNGKIVFTASSTLIVNCIITSGYGNVTVT